MATQEQKDNFINTIAPIICTQCTVRGWGVPSAIIAQAICESNWGLSGLAKYNNLFGMKCGTSWRGSSVNMTTKEEYTSGILTTIKDNFRTYSSVAEGIDGYFQFLSTSRYAPVRAAKDYVTYITELKKCGYATSSTYVNTLTNIVTTNGLTKYDLNSAAPTKVTYIVGHTYSSTVKLNIRTAPRTDAEIIKQYNSGDKVVCKEKLDVDGTPWIRTPIGWVCTQANGKYYLV